MLSRRRFLQVSAAASAGLLGHWQFLAPHVQAQGILPLDPLLQPRFINPLPNPLDDSFIFAPTGGSHYDIGMEQFTQALGLVDPATGAPLMTPLWGYSGVPKTGGGASPTYPGRTFVVQRDQQITVRWTNSLPKAHLLPVDTSLHWAYSAPGYTTRTIAADGVPVVPHVHGGHTESDSDGLPEYWFTPNFALKGPRWVKENYVYDNDQEAGTLWYHDHGLGITRVNVYAGLAGFYLVRDTMDTGLANNPLGLPAHPYEVPIVIQDRMFLADGSLFFPSAPLLAGQPNPSVLPEFFGNVILVNGQAWPFMNVEPRKYRFRILNGSDSRFYEMWITASNAPAGPIWMQVGTDDALLNAPVPVTKLVVGPGERVDVVVDFAGFEGQTLVVRNNARSPYPKGVTVNPNVDGQIMAFNVGPTVTVPDVPLAATLRPAPIPVLGPAVRTRKLLLFEGTDSEGRLQPMLGVAEPTLDVNGGQVNGTLLWDELHYAITENPGEGDTEIWEVYNTTVDAHPIHLHLVSFQILNRQKFSGTIAPKTQFAHDGSTSTGGTLSGIRLRGQPKPPAANEAGWKDTAQMFPGEVTRIIAKFDRPGRYVWHCHILSHEDHEMMRPYHVGPLPALAAAMATGPYPATAAYWLANSQPGANYDPIWGQVGDSGAIFLNGLSYGDVLLRGQSTNLWLRLGREYVAAELNQLAGATASANTVDSMFLAKGVLGSNTPDTTLSAADQLLFQQLTDILAAFNNGG